MREPRQVPVVFVGGMGRSGSTLISRVLGRVPGLVAVGEMHYLWDQGVRNDRLCGCGSVFSACPFWKAVGAAAFGGWHRVDAAEAHSLRRRIVRNRFVPLLLAPVASRSFSRDVERYASLMAAVYRGVREVSGADVVVDTSKYPSSGYLLRRVGGVDLRLLHLVRASHGVAHSWAKTVARPDRTERTLARFPPARIAVEWTAYNFAYDALRAIGVPGVVLRYEDFVARPREELLRVLAALGHPRSPADLAFIGPDGLDLPRDHSVAGNPMRFRTGPESLRLDDAWHSDMPISTQRLVTALSAPGLVRFGYLPRRRPSSASGPRRSHSPAA